MDLELDGPWTVLRATDIMYQAMYLVMYQRDRASHGIMVRPIYLLSGRED